MAIILAMNKQIYIVLPHTDGYQVIEARATRGISTHANLLDALAACRAANRFVRELQTEETFT